MKSPQVPAITLRLYLAATSDSRDPTTPGGPDDRLDQRVVAGVRLAAGVDHPHQARAAVCSRMDGKTADARMLDVVCGLR
jgi:hypothetical protein